MFCSFKVYPLVAIIVVLINLLMNIIGIKFSNKLSFFIYIFLWTPW